MQRVWMLLLAGCGFQSSAAPDAATIADGEISTVDAAIGDAIAALPGCVSVSYQALNVSACPVALPDSLAISATTSIDTAVGTSIPLGLTCAALMPGSTDVCAIAAKTITLTAGTILSAHGAKPLVLLGHTIDIEGTIDVSSHVNGQQGAGSDVFACAVLKRAVGNGGGQGGTFVDSSGGNGGAVDGSASETGGPSASSLGIDVLRGGCPGGPSSMGSLASGGHGGGAVWLAVDTDGTLTLGASAVINASGASGVGGVPTMGSRGGFGGGSGGMILIKAPTVTFATSMLLANGGGGGGGAASENAGGAGGDPTSPLTGGTGGAGGTPVVMGDTGAGGAGFPASAEQRNGHNSVVTNGAQGTNGAGGGGGGPGAIWIDGATNGSVLASPTPLMLR